MAGAVGSVSANVPRIICDIIFVYENAYYWSHNCQTDGYAT